MEKPYVRKEAKEPSGVFTGIQATHCLSDRDGFKDDCRIEPRASDQRFSVGDLERSVFGTCPIGVWRSPEWSGADSGVGTRAGTPAHGVGDSKKSVQAAAVALRVKTAKVLGDSYPLRLVCRLLAVPRSSVQYRHSEPPDLERL